MCEEGSVLVQAFPNLDVAFAVGRYAIVTTLKWLRQSFSYWMRFVTSLRRRFWTETFFQFEGVSQSGVQPSSRSYLKLLKALNGFVDGASIHSVWKCFNLIEDKQNAVHKVFWPKWYLLACYTHRGECMSHMLLHQVTTFLIHVEFWQKSRFVSWI